MARRRYDRNAPFYDLMEGVMERFSFARWRKLLWSKVEGDRILEVGVGTGKNFAFYPQGSEIVAIDFSERMIKRARKRAVRQDVAVTLHQMDVQNMSFLDASFDTVVATFVFCSVPDPVQGLQEVARVCKPGGKVILLEHMISANRILAAIMNLANPIVVRITGANINRRTVENVRNSGLVVERVTNLRPRIVKLIEARKSAG